MQIALLLALTMASLGGDRSFVYDTQHDRIGRLNHITMCIRWFPRTSFSTETCLPAGDTGYSDGEFAPDSNYIEMEEEDLGDFLRKDYPDEELINEMEDWRQDKIDNGIDTHEKERNPQGPEIVDYVPNYP